MIRGKFSFLFFILVCALGTYAQQVPNGNHSSNGTSTGASVTLPNEEGSFKFAAVGDTGRGTKVQYELGTMMAQIHDAFKYDTVILTGDNMYYSQKAEDYVKKFELPYKALLDRDVKFYASLGNHDEANQVNYKFFNMNGKEYFRFVKGNVSFYSLNTTYLDAKQIGWFISELEKDTSKWKIAFFHHPPYSSAGRHGSDEKIREALHPLFVKHGIDVVFTGHDHTYERIKPVDGIQYFVTGAGGEVRKGDLKKRSQITMAGFDTDLSFMVMEIIGDQMHFRSISRTGATVDSGIIQNRTVEGEPQAETTREPDAATENNTAVPKVMAAPVASPLPSPRPEASPNFQ